MVKLNRIGNKLGLAGAVGILLAIGMIANQTMTESSVAEVNTLNGAQQELGENARGAEVSMRQIQLAGRNIRLVRTPAEVEKTVAELRGLMVVEIGRAHV